MSQALCDIVCCTARSQRSDPSALAKDEDSKGQAVLEPWAQSSTDSVTCNNAVPLWKSFYVTPTNKDGEPPHGFERDPTTATPNSAHLKVCVFLAKHNFCGNISSAHTPSNSSEDITKGLQEIPPQTSSTQRARLLPVTRHLVKSSRNPVMKMAKFGSAGTPWNTNAHHNLDMQINVTV